MARIHILYIITKTSLSKYILKILPPTNENFQIKNSDIFHISAQNLHCEYSLEPPWRGEAVLTSTHNLCFEQKIRKIMYTPVNPNFTIYM